MTRLLRSALLVCLVLAAAVPASATTTSTLRTERVYFECPDANKARLVNNLQGDYDGWSTDAPAESVQQGAGCGTSSTLFNDEQLSGTWDDTFTGNLDSMTVEVHVIDAGLARHPSDPGYAVFPYLWIDGERVLDPAESIRVQSVRSATQASTMLRFTITGIDRAEEDGDGETERTIKLQVGGTAGWNGVIVQGTTEVPSGITFNPAEPEATTIKVAG